MKQVFVAEDQEPQRELMVILLERAGFKVDSAENGSDALNRIDVLGGVDLLITDIGMPILDGYELIRKLAERKYEFPIIVHSRDTRDEAIAYSGKLEYIAKNAPNGSWEKVVTRAKEILG